MNTMGKNLSSMLVNMTDLILKETDVSRMKQLRKQHRALIKQLQTLIDKTVPNDTAKYRQATKALLEANEVTTTFCIPQNSHETPTVTIVRPASLSYLIHAYGPNHL